jgi:hypothetical protein
MPDMGEAVIRVDETLGGAAVYVELNACARVSIFQGMNVTVRTHEQKLGTLQEHSEFDLLLGRALSLIPIEQPSWRETLRWWCNELGRIRSDVDLEFQVNRVHGSLFGMGALGDTADRELTDLVSLLAVECRRLLRQIESGV